MDYVRSNRTGGSEGVMPGTKTKYVSLKIVVNADDEKLCGVEACPRFAALDLNGAHVKGLDGRWYGRRACSCGAFRLQLNWPPPVRRCDGCLEAKEL